MTSLRRSIPLSVAIVALAVALPFTPASLAQTPPQREPQAIAVLQQSLTAMGSGWQLVADTAVQANVSSGDSVAGAQTVSIRTLGGDRIRWDGAGGPLLLLSGGKRLRFAEGRWQAAVSITGRHQRVEHLPALLIVNELNRGDVTVTYVGREAVGDRQAHRVRFARVSSLRAEFDQKFTAESELDVFIDVTSGLVLKISYQYYGAQDWRVGVPMEVQYSDYQSQGSLVVPMRQRTLLNGNLITDIQITSFAANAGVDSRDFEVGR